MAVQVNAAAWAPLNNDASHLRNGTTDTFVIQYSGSGAVTRVGLKKTTSDPDGWMGCGARMVIGLLGGPPNKKLLGGPPNK